MFKRGSLGIQLVALLVFAGCGDHMVQVPNASGLPTLGELEALIKASTAPDSDGDFIPDDVELDPLKTNPQDRDSDHDGLPDNYEIFGDGLFDPGAYVPDKDQDGIIAARDKDDDNNYVNDGLYIDTDGDTIANYLEYYGFYYDWLTGRFVSCEDVSCSGLTVYRTDPLQRSTDQDPYSDAMEASGLNMDVSVIYPGGHPLVPAGPLLTVELAAYSITLNEKITYSRGGSLSQGTTWTQSTTRSHSNTNENSWGIGVKAGIGFQGEKVTGSVEVSTNYGAKWSNTSGTSHSVSRSDSVVSQANWSEARSLNPTDVAHVKLMLKARNYGSACLSNAVPTLTLRVAGLNVTTFEPGNAQIELLPPYATYPADDGVFWVVDRTASGAPISLTMKELRAFESGAPISIAVTQVRADVLRLGSTGGWETVGDVNEFLTRCDAASVDLRLDMGDGSSVHRMVYCGSGPSEPRVTLLDALRWSMGGYEDENGLWITYLDKDDIPQQVSLEDWRFIFDRKTMSLNGIDPDDLAGTLTADYRVSQMVLHPDSTIFGKAPRTAEQPKPAVHFAYIDYDNRMARVCTTDYRGVDEVVIEAWVDPLNGTTPDPKVYVMTEEPLDSNMYVRAFTAGEWAVVGGILDRQMDPATPGSDTLKVIVTSWSGEMTEAPLGLIPPNPRAVAPIIDFIRLDMADGWLYARARPDENYPELWQLQYPIDWVQAFHGGFPGGTIEMEAPPNWYQDPHGWICELPTGWTASTAIKVVAYVAAGVYAERFVTPSDVASAYNEGNADFHLQHLDGINNLAIDKVWAWDWLDVESAFATPGGTKKMTGSWLGGDGPPDYPDEGLASSDSGWLSAWEPSDQQADFLARYLNESGKSGWKLYFKRPSLLVAPGVAYEDITSSWADAHIPATTNTEGQAFADQDIWIFKTTSGRTAKLQITFMNTWDKSVWWYFFGAKYGKACKFSFKYLVFDSTQASILAPTLVYYDKDADGIELDGSGSAGAHWQWEVLEGPTDFKWDDAFDLLDNQAPIATLYPASKKLGYEQLYRIRLKMDTGVKNEERAEVEIKVVYPQAVIDDIPEQEFDPADPRRVALPGGNSVRARSYLWSIVSAPTTPTGAVIEAADRSSGILKPDVAGDYIVKLLINGGDADEDEITRQLKVTFNP